MLKRTSVVRQPSSFRQTLLGRYAGGWSHDQPACGFCDVLSVDPGRSQQLLRLAGAGHTPNRQLYDPRRLLAVGESGEDGLAEPALRPVILDRHDPPTGGLRRGRERTDVDRLERVEIDDARRDAVFGQAVGCGERLAHRDPGGDDRDVVLVGGAQDAAAADLELLVRTVDDLGRGTQRADIRDAVYVSHRRDELRGLVRVAGVQDDAAVDGAQRGNVLEAHL